MGLEPPNENAGKIPAVEEKLTATGLESKQRKGGGVNEEAGLEWLRLEKGLSRGKENTGTDELREAVVAPRGDPGEEDEVDKTGKENLKTSETDVVVGTVVAVGTVASIVEVKATSPLFFS